MSGVHPSRSSVAAPALEFRAVDYGYARPSDTFDGLDFAVPAGQFCAVIGANGSGKTTLVRLGLGLLHAQAGRVAVFGEPIGRFRSWQRVGYVPQRLPLDPDLPATVREIVATGCVPGRGILARRRSGDAARIDAALQAADIDALAGRRASRLSGGQLQRVFLARALAGEPELLVLDEPTAAVDTEHTVAFLQTITALHTRHHLAVLMVSHDLPTLAPHVDRIVTLADGAIVADESTAQAHPLPGDVEPEREPAPEAATATEQLDA